MQKCPELMKGLIITGSSGLYEAGESYQKRGSYEYIKRESEDVFYDQKLLLKR
jgi:hypothetical protein